MGRDRERRAVITGMGLVTPVGNGVGEYWQALLAGCSGIGEITLFGTEGWAVRIGGEVKGIDFLRRMSAASAKNMPRAAKLAVVAAKMALEDAALQVTDDNRCLIDIFLGVACPDLQAVARTVMRRVRQGARHADPLAPAQAVTAAPAGNISIELGIAGESTTFSTGCSSGTNAIGHALRKIRSGEGEVILAGGADAGVQEDLVACYARAMQLSTRNEAPEEASRPFEANRDGHVLSEAAGILVVEEYEHAKARGARIYAELRGYGASSDCGSMLRVAKDVRSSARCVGNALRSAGVAAGEVDYYCAHGSSARATDARETRMLKAVFGEHAARMPVSSIKSMTGHPFGASGALQTAACALAITRGAVPPTINYDEPDPECDLDYVPNHARDRKVSVAVNYALGMGGNNAALVVAAC